MVIMKRIILLITLLAITTSVQGSEFVTAEVRDISDRKYENAVMELIDNAKLSVYVSVFVVSAEVERVQNLLDGLERAIRRNVEVEFWVNTNRITGDVYVMPEGIWRLKDLGAKIHEVKSGYCLHDKLIIVDEHFIVEGSTNWSDNAFTDNFESSTLMDSKLLAKVKINRLKKLPLIGQKKRIYVKPKYVPERNTTLPKIIELHKALITNKNYLPLMVPKTSNRAYDIYLLLVRESILRNKTTFFLNLEHMAELLNMPTNKPDEYNRRLIIKVLKQLEKRYKLINLVLNKHKDAKITLKPIEGEKFPLPSKLIEPYILNKYNPSTSIMMLIQQCLKSEGITLDSISKTQIKARFHIGKHAQSNAIKDIS